MTGDPPRRWGHASFPTPCSRYAVVCATRMGRGSVIRIVDNLNFRGVWYGTNKLFANTLFFGGLIKRTRALGF